MALAVVKKIGEILKRHDVNAGYSRTTGVFVALSEIARKANSFFIQTIVGLRLLILQFLGKLK